MFASCGGDGPEKIAGPVTDGTTTSPPGTGATPPNGGATTPPTGTTPPADTTATTPPTGTTPPTTGGTTPPDTSAATPPGTGGTTPPSTGGTTGTVTAIAIVPSSLTLALGDTTTLKATLTTSGTPPAGGWTVTWETTDPSVAVVTTTGKVSALAVGSVAIKATAGGKSATLVVTVSAQPFVRSVGVTPASATMLVGEKATFTAVIGSVGATPVGGWPVSWQSSLTQYATVDAAGVVTAIAPGSSRIAAFAGNGVGFADVLVVSGPTVLGIALSPATLYLGLGGTGSFTPALTTVGTPPAGGWPITWKTELPAIATVDAAGVVTGVAPGSTTITATSGTKSASATIAVATAGGGTASVVSAVTINSPFSAWVAVGNQRTLSASVTANGPPPENGWAIAWTSSDPSVAAVSPTGVLSAVSPGKATISATVGGVTGTRAIEVLPQPGVVSISIDVVSDGWQVGDTYAYTASIFMVGSVPPGGLVMTWASDNPAVASITTDGVLTAKATGTVTITVTAYGKSASLPLTIFPKVAAPPPPAITGITSVSISPAVSVVASAGGRGGLIATVVATSTKPPGAVSWPVEWTSSNPAVVSNLTSGYESTGLDGLAEGVATITASLGGKSATSTVYVATPKAISVAPSAPALSVGQQLPLVTTVTTTGPLPPSGFPVSYQSTSPLVATVSSTGVITALGAGTTKIWIDATRVNTSVIAAVSGPPLTVNVNAPATTKGTITQSSTGYSVACNFVWSADASGSGVARWGKWLTSVDGVNFVDMGYNGFRGDVLAAGSTLIGLGRTASGPVTSTAAPWTMTMRFNYAVNASNLDSTLNGLFAPWIVVNTIEKTFTCAP